MPMIIPINTQIIRIAIKITPIILRNNILANYFFSGLPFFPIVALNTIGGGNATPPCAPMPSPVFSTLRSRVV
jgi:hypothetical protein